MQHNTLQQLKLLMLNESDISQIGYYFATHLMDDQEFHDLSKPSEHSILPVIISKICGQFLDRDVKLNQLLLSKVQSTEFYHGTVMVEGRLCLILCLDDEKIGFLMLDNHQHSGQTEFFRFRYQVSTGKKGVSIYPYKNNTQH